MPSEDIRELKEELTSVRSQLEESAATITELREANQKFDTACELLEAARTEFTELRVKKDTAEERLDASQQVIEAMVPSYPLSVIAVQA